MSGSWGLRLRALLDRRLGAIVVVLIVLVALGGWLTYDAYVQRETTVEQRQVTAWEATGEFTHRATVIDNVSRVGPVFSPGEVVRNRTVYYRSIMPTLDGTFRYGYAADSGELDVRVSQRLVIRSVGGLGDRQTEYWRQTRSLGTKEATLAPGEHVQTSFSVNVTEAVATAARIHERLGDPGETRVSVNVTVAVTGTAGGRQVDRTLEYSLPLGIQSGVYRVGDGSGTRAFTRTEQVTVVQEPGAIASVGGPLLLVVSYLVGFGIAYAQRKGGIALTPQERAWLEYRDDRADFDEWISTIRLPEEAESLPVAEADSLADLVDFAIDTDNAVLESPDTGVYHVVHDGYRYTFEAPPGPTATDTRERDAPATDADEEQATEAESESEREPQDGEETDAETPPVEGTPPE